MKLVVLKPDHLGDLVLSAPAINKLLTLNHDITLIINKNVEFLAQYLFPNIKLAYATFTHLSRTNETTSIDEVFELVKTSDLLVSLRNDPELQKQVFYNIDPSKLLITGDSLDVHETTLHSECLEPLTGAYLPLDFFNTYKNTYKIWPTQIKKLGLSISAGFFNNSLSVLRWIEIARYFTDHYQAEIYIICGPNEYEEAIILKALLQTCQIIKGSKNLVEFLDPVSELDLVIATDSGTAHLCSLSGVPIMSLFGASPYKRFRPLGHYNKVVTLDYNCSPCPQFEVKKINHCITKECLNNISVQQIASHL